MMSRDSIRTEFSLHLNFRHGAIYDFASTVKKLMRGKSMYPVQLSGEKPSNRV